MTSFEYIFPCPFTLLHLLPTILEISLAIPEKIAQIKPYPKTAHFKIRFYSKQTSGQALLKSIPYISKTAVFMKPVNGCCCTWKSNLNSGFKFCLCFLEHRRFFEHIWMAKYRYIYLETWFIITKTRDFWHIYAKTELDIKYKKFICEFR